MQLIDISSISYFKYRSIQESHFLKQQGARKKTKKQKRRPAIIKMLKAKQTAITKLQFGVGTKTQKNAFLRKTTLPA